MRLVGAFLRLELDVRRAQAAGLALFGAGVPLALAAAVRGIAPGGDLARLPVGVLLLSSALVVFRHLGYSVEVERVARTTALLDTTRLGRWHYLAARCLESLVLAAIPLACTVAVGLWDRAPLRLGPAELAAYVLWVLVLWAGALGVLGVLRAPLSFQALNLGTLLLAALFPLFYADSAVPPALAAATAWLPPTLAIRVLGGGAAASALPLAAWAAGLLAVAAARAGAVTGLRG
jgi:hypothetical protein